MKDMHADYIKTDFFNAKIHDRICTIELKNCSMLDSIDLRCRDRLVQFLDYVSKSTTVKVIVAISPDSVSCCERYIAFYDRIYQSKLSEKDLLRACRSLDQVMLKIVESPKFFIGVNSGKLFPEAYCWDLACDYRIISDNTTFQNTCLDYGITPKGGVAYFLEKFIGRSKTAKLLLSNVPIHSDQALSLGLVNKVVPNQQLEAAAWETAQYYSRQPQVSVAGIKKMLNFSYKDLEEYLEFETKMNARALRRTFSPFMQRD